MNLRANEKKYRGETSDILKVIDIRELLEKEEAYLKIQGSRITPAAKKTIQVFRAFREKHWGADIFNVTPHLNYDSVGLLQLEEGKPFRGSVKPEGDLSKPASSKKEEAADTPSPEANLTYNTNKLQGIFYSKLWTIKQVRTMLWRTREHGFHFGNNYIAFEKTLSETVRAAIKQALRENSELKNLDVYEYQGLLMPFFEYAWDNNPEAVNKIVSEYVYEEDSHYKTSKKNDCIAPWLNIREDWWRCYTTYEPKNAISEYGT